MIRSLLNSKLAFDLFKQKCLNYIIKPRAVKSTTALLLLSDLLLLFGPKCKKEKHIPQELPPITQEGRNTFGCRVNGEIWVPYNCSSAHPCINAASVFPAIPPNMPPFAVEISVYTMQDDNARSWFQIATQTNIGISAAGDKKDSLYIQFVKPGFPIYRCYSGVTITKFDQVNKILSGTFEGTLYNSVDSLKITEGRFDYSFQH